MKTNTFGNKPMRTPAVPTLADLKDDKTRQRHLIGTTGMPKSNGAR